MQNTLPKPPRGLEGQFFQNSYFVIFHNVIKVWILVHCEALGCSILSTPQLWSCSSIQLLTQLLCLILMQLCRFRCIYSWCMPVKEVVHTICASSFHSRLMMTIYRIVPLLLTFLETQRFWQHMAWAAI